jgi:hypothetical protein
MGNILLKEAPTHPNIPLEFKTRPPRPPEFKTHPSTHFRNQPLTSMMSG